MMLDFNSLVVSFISVLKKVKRFYFKLQLHIKIQQESLGYL